MSDPVLIKLYSGEAVIAHWPEKAVIDDPWGIERPGRELIKPLGVQYRLLQPSGQMQPALVSWAAEKMFIYDAAIMGIGHAPKALADAYLQAISGIKIAKPDIKIPASARQT
jgi:hypothetical protein